MQKIKTSWFAFGLLFVCSAGASAATGAQLGISLIQPLPYFLAQGAEQPSSLAPSNPVRQNQGTQQDNQNVQNQANAALTQAAKKFDETAEDLEQRVETAQQQLQTLQSRTARMLELLNRFQKVQAQMLGGDSNPQLSAELKQIRDQLNELQGGTAGTSN